MTISAYSCHKTEVTQIVISIFKEGTYGAIYTREISRKSRSSEHLIIIVISSIESCGKFVFGIGDDRIVYQITIPTLLLYIIAVQPKIRILTMRLKRVLQPYTLIRCVRKYIPYFIRCTKALGVYFTAPRICSSFVG